MVFILGKEGGRLMNLVVCARDDGWYFG